MRAGEKLRVDVRSSQVTPLIGVFDMFSASLTAQHYGGMFVSGFGFAVSYYGPPDIQEGAVDVAASIALLERNISRHHKTRETVEV